MSTHHGPHFGPGNFLALSLVPSSSAGNMCRVWGAAHLLGWNSGSVKELVGSEAENGGRANLQESGHGDEFGLNPMGTKDMRSASEQ